VNLLGLCVTIQFAKESITILGGGFRQVIDKGLDPIPAGIPKDGGPAEIGGVTLDETGIELVLTDQEAKPIAKTGLANSGAVPGSRVGSGSIRGLDEGTAGAELFDRAQTDAVGLAQGAIDGSSLGDAHLGTADQGRDVRGIGVSIADEAFRVRTLVDSCFKHPAASRWIRQCLLDCRSNSKTSAAFRDAEQSCMRHVPTALQELEVALSHR
jgi:hypothetical protein